MPASHSSLYGTSIPSRGSATPHDFHSLISSPISILSPFGPKGAKKLPDIGETMPFEPRSKLTPSGSIPCVADVHAMVLPESQTTPTGSEKRHSVRDRRGNQPSKGSPQLLRRRRSRDELSSPNPESRVLFSVGGGTDVGSLVSTPSSTRTGGGELARHGKGNEGSIKHEKSPEIVVDDVSGSSMSTGSFDVSIQLLDVTSPPQIILKSMENQE